MTNINEIVGKVETHYLFPDIPLACPTCGSKNWGSSESVGEYWRKCDHDLQRITNRVGGME